LEVCGVKTVANDNSNRDDSDSDLLAPMTISAFVRLLSQSLAELRRDVNRLADKSRRNNDDIQAMKLGLAKTDELQQQQINRIASDLNTMFSRFWTVMLGLIGTILALFIQSAIKK
jgi:hypothetical protein